MDQGLQQFANLVAKTTPSETVTITDAPFDRSSIEAVDAANLARRGPEPDWRGELDQLQTQLFWADTEAIAKDKAEAITREHNRMVSDVERNIHELRKNLAIPYLSLHTAFNPNGEPLVTFKGQKCGCDGCAILTKIQRYQDALPQMKTARERAIRLAGSAVQSSRERDKLRPRYKELAQRAAEIDRARSSTKGPVDDGDFRAEGLTNADERRSLTAIKSHRI
jgi:hypothetical protein